MGFAVGLPAVYDGDNEGIEVLGKLDGDDVGLPAVYVGGLVGRAVVGLKVG